MWAVLDSFGVDFTRILYSCELVKVDLPDVQTVIGLVGGLLFLLGFHRKEVYGRYFAVCHTQILVAVFYFFGWGSLSFK